MEPNVSTVGSILSAPLVCLVPFYQRKYQWTDDQINPLWDDILSKVPGMSKNGIGSNHYLGALIFAHDKAGSPVLKTPRVRIIDGQQRLTTFLLLLASIREVAQEFECTELANKVNDFIFNKPLERDIDIPAKYKVIPNHTDQEKFFDLIEMSFTSLSEKYLKSKKEKFEPSDSSNLPLRCYLNFHKNIKAFMERQQTAAEENGVIFADKKHLNKIVHENRIKSLLTATLDKMKVVEIYLDEGDNPQVIYESINSKNSPLLAMDLVRNDIYYRSLREDVLVDDLYKSLWNALDDSWWGEDAPFARPKRPRIDHFLLYALVAETGKTISMRKLYHEYRSFAIPNGTNQFKSVIDEVKFLNDYRPIYETLEGRDNIDDSLSDIGQKLRIWKTSAPYPVVLHIFKNISDLSEQKSLYEFLYSYIVRRTICGLPKKNLNYVFHSLTGIFAQSKPSIENVTKFFTENFDKYTRFPKDEEFKKSFIENQLFESKRARSAQIRDILWALEIKSHEEYTEIIGQTDLSLEHVMPQSWNEVNWPFKEEDIKSSKTKEQKILERNETINRIGNLTLIRSGLNNAIGNKSFTEKKKLIKKHGVLFLNRYFVDKEFWSEDEINERGRELAELAIKVWPDFTNLK